MAGAILWGTTGTTQSLAPAAAQPITVGTLRLLTGGMLLLLWAWAHKRLESPLHWKRTPLLSGIIGVAAYQLFFFSAVDRTGVAVGTIVGIGSAPVLAGILDLAVRGEQLSRRWFASTAIAILGCALLTLSDQEAGIDSVGIAFAIGAGASYAVYALSSKILLDDHAPDAVMAWLFGAGAVLLLPLLFLNDVSWAFEPTGALVVLHLGVITVALAYILFARGLKYVPSSTAVTLSLAEPLTAGMLGIGLLGEHLSTNAILGIALLLISLLWLAAGRSQQNKNVILPADHVTYSSETTSDL